MAQSVVVGEHRWSGRLVLWATVLTLANVLADVVIGSPMMVLPQLLDHFDTDQVAWLNASAMLAGAMWSPLLAKSSDILGTRRILVSTLLLAGVGALICLAAPSLWMFLVGRFLQGAAFAAVFLTVALARRICGPRVAMMVVGIVTSCSSVVGIIEPFLMAPLIGAFGFRSVFIAAALLAAVAALGVRWLIPESPVRGTGRVDVVGALLLGGGLCAVLGYASLGQTLGWCSAGMVALVAVGLAALAGWVFRTLRVDEPVIDIRAIGRPILLTLLALALAAGAFRAMLQLIGIVAQVPSSSNLGYGLGEGEAIAVLLAVPNLGIAVGGICAGWIAGRRGAAAPLLGGIAIGVVGAFGMLAGVSVLPVAIACGGMLGVAAGAIGASGYNTATGFATPERQGTIAGVVSVVLAVGSVVVTIAGGEVLKATRVPETSGVDGPVGTASGVYVYVVLTGVLFAVALIPAIMLLRRRFSMPESAPSPTLPAQLHVRHR